MNLFNYCSSYIILTSCTTNIISNIINICITTLFLLILILQNKYISLNSRDNFKRYNIILIYTILLYYIVIVLLLLNAIVYFMCMLYILLFLVKIKIIKLQIN